MTAFASHVTYKKDYETARRYSHSNLSHQRQSHLTYSFSRPPLLKRGHRTLTQCPELLYHHNRLSTSPQPQHLGHKDALLLLSHIDRWKARIQQSSFEMLFSQPRLREDERAKGFTQRLYLRALGQPTNVKDEGLGERSGKGSEDGEGRDAAGRQGVGGAWVGETQ